MPRAVGEAQQLTDQASAKVTEALNSGGWDGKPHALKAKTLLEQASKELGLAATNS